jgi:hypothetical protein
MFCMMPPNAVVSWGFLCEHGADHAKEHGDITRKGWGWVRKEGNGGQQEEGPEHRRWRKR